MLSLEIYKKVPIYHVGNDLYSGLEKANEKFYFCDPYHYKIVEYDKCLQQVASYKVKKRFTHITYSHCHKCFYAVSSDYCNKVFKLNECFEEEDCYDVKTCCCVIFNGIDCYDDKLYLSCGCYILTVLLSCMNKPEVWIEEEQRLSHVAKTPHYLLTSLSNCDNSHLVVYDNCKCLQLTCCLSCQYHIQDITCDCENIYILVSKCDCYQFVLICQLNKHCHKEPCHQGCTDIIESIALIETSLSHILNAEGEKLQKIIATSDDPDVILEVNDAVNHT
ncbi:MAG: hypothetical protein RR512_05655, partial [Coprobacillus sp.]